jgi:hypothetical protein
LLEEQDEKDEEKEKKQGEKQKDLEKCGGWQRRLNWLAHLWFS